MEESRTQRLQQLLKRLGRAVHGSVVQSDEIRECLEELHDNGWRAVMLLEASLVCSGGGELEAEEGTIHIHVDPRDANTDYLLDAEDARFLSTLGISPTRHRSRRSRPRFQADDQSDR